MNQAQVTTLVGAITAALLAGSQMMTHSKIDEVSENTIPRSTLEVNQTRHDDEIDAIQARVALLEQLHVVDRGHEHEEETK